MKVIKNKDTYISISKNGEFYLSTEKKDLVDFEHFSINTNLSVDANTEAQYNGKKVLSTEDFLDFNNLTVKENGFDVEYKLTTKNLFLIEEVEFINGTNVIKQRTIAKNSGREDIRLSKLTCANVIGIGIDGSKYYDSDRFYVYYCVNRWQGEGQWRKKSLKDIDIFPSCLREWEKASFRIQSFSSWSTNEYYPLVIIEDKEKGECWFFEREGAENWYIEINAFGGWNCPFINVVLGGNDEIMGWTQDLKSGDSYTTSNAIYGVVKGNFEDAVKELHKYKRQDVFLKSNIEATYNTYMNCNWGYETKARVMPLVDAAAEAGFECFIIDSGWEIAGSWQINERWPNNDFQEVIDYIKSKGMRAGAWMELDCAGTVLDEKYLRLRDGKIVANHRPKVDMRKPISKKLLLDAIDRLYNMGIRYIKNDHNNDEGVGSNYFGEKAAEGTKQNTLAFYSLIIEIRNRYPDLKIENCASGGGREDNGTLKFFDLESISDQEDYKLNPSILIGTLANIPPERCGSWGYPYPILGKYAGQDYIQDDVKETFVDGRETVFNLVSAMTGYMYVSGRINLMDELNKQLLKESIIKYKSYKDTIKNRKVAFVLPMKNMDDKTFNAVGLVDNDMLLSIWALEQQKFKIDLKRFNFKTADIFYPTCINDFSISFNNGILSVFALKKYSACLLILKK